MYLWKSREEDISRSRGHLPPVVTGLQNYQLQWQQTNFIYRSLNNPWKLYNYFSLFAIRRAENSRKFAPHEKWKFYSIHKEFFQWRTKFENNNVSILLFQKCTSSPRMATVRWTFTILGDDGPSLLPHGLPENAKTETTRSSFAIPRPMLHNNDTSSILVSWME